MAAISFKLETFEGPLDLLLHLVSKHKLNIYDIEISLLLEQYLDYMSKIETQDYEQAADFLEMAARLIYIKTCYLLPKPEEAEELKKELEGRMIEYSLCKLTAQKLRELYAGGSIFVRDAVKLPVNKTYSRIHDVTELFDAYMAISTKAREYHPLRANVFSPIVARKIVSVESKITQILELLYTTGRFTMSELYEGMTDRSERIAAFLAVLELTKSGRIALNDDNTEVTLRRDYDPELEEDEEPTGSFEETEAPAGSEPELEAAAAEEAKITEPETAPDEPAEVQAEEPAERPDGESDEDAQEAFADKPAEPGEEPTEELGQEPEPELIESASESIAAAEEPEAEEEPEQHCEVRAPRPHTASLAIPPHRIMMTEPLAVAAFAPMIKKETESKAAEPEKQELQDKAPEPAAGEQNEQEPEAPAAAAAETAEEPEPAEVPEPEKEELSALYSEEKMVSEEFERAVLAEPAAEKEHAEKAASEPARLPEDTGFTLKANLWGERWYWGRSDRGSYRLLLKTRI